MSIYALKPRFQALLRPAASALARGGITALLALTIVNRVRGALAETAGAAP